MHLRSPLTKVNVKLEELRATRRILNELRESAFQIFDFMTLVSPLALVDYIYLSSSWNIAISETIKDLDQQIKSEEQNEELTSSILNTLIGINDILNSLWEQQVGYFNRVSEQEQRKAYADRFWNAAIIHNNKEAFPGHRARNYLGLHQFVQQNRDKFSQELARHDLNYRIQEGKKNRLKSSEGRNWSQLFTQIQQRNVTDANLNINKDELSTTESDSTSNKKSKSSSSSTSELDSDHYKQIENLTKLVNNSYHDKWSSDTDSSSESPDEDSDCELPDSRLEQIMFRR